MSFDIQSGLEYLQFDQNAAIILFTAVVYDYLLVFPGEIQYIWCKPWTWVTTLFVLVRYIGLCWTFAFGFLNSVFFPGSVIVSTAISLVISWTWELFIISVDMVMVLRVYAMWNRSKIILGVLLCIFVPQVIIAFVFTGLYSSTYPYFSVSTIQILNISLCNFSFNVPSPHWLYMIPHSVLSLALLILAVTQALKQSFDMYKATKKWQLNQYMKLLVREGIAYFFLRVLYDIADFISITGGAFLVSTLFLGTLVTIPLFTMLPRFIVGVREMYERDLTRRWEGIDTAFGVLSGPFASENTAVSTVTFSDVAPGQGQILEEDEDADDSEAIQLEVVGVTPVSLQV